MPLKCLRGEKEEKGANKNMIPSKLPPWMQVNLAMNAVRISIHDEMSSDLVEKMLSYTVSLVENLPPSTEKEDYEKTLTELTDNNIHSGPVIPILPKLSLGNTAEKLVSALTGVVPALGKTITDAVKKLTGLGGSRRKQQKGLDAIEATLAAVGIGLDELKVFDDELRNEKNIKLKLEEGKQKIDAILKDLKGSTTEEKVNALKDLALLTQKELEAFTKLKDHIEKQTLVIDKKSNLNIAELIQQRDDLQKRVNSIKTTPAVPVAKTNTVGNGKSDADVIKQLNDQIIDLNQSIVTAQTDARQVKADLDGQLKKANQKISELEAQITKDTETNVKLQEKIKAQAADAQVQVDAAVQKREAELNAEIGDLNDQISIIKAAENKIIAELRVELDQAKASASGTLQAAITSVETQLATAAPGVILSKKLVEVNAQLDAANNMVNTRKAEAAVSDGGSAGFASPAPVIKPTKRIRTDDQTPIESEDEQKILDLLEKMNPGMIDRMQNANVGQLIKQKKIINGRTEFVYFVKISDGIYEPLNDTAYDKEKENEILAWSDIKRKKGTIALYIAKLEEMVNPS